MPRNFKLVLKLFGLVVDGLERCRTCQIGEYQSEYAQVTCSACPGGKSTISRGATSLHQCKGKKKLRIYPRTASQDPLLPIFQIFMQPRMTL